jgi:hypothetical protein
MLRAFHKTVPNGWPFNDLERLLTRAATDAAQRVPFVNALLAGHVYVLGSSARPGGAEGARTIPAGEKLELRTVPTQSGPAILAFTSLEILRLSIDGESRWTMLPAKSLLEVSAGSGILLNPCGPFGKELTPGEIRLALGGIVAPDEHRLQVARPTRALLGRLAVEPSELLDQVSRFCSTQPSVEAAYTSGICMPQTGEAKPHPLIGIECVGYDAVCKALSPTIESWANAHTTAVDVVNMGERTALTEHLRTAGGCFYRRTR